MKTRLICIMAFAVGLNTAMNAQLNDYKYIIVPKQFSAFKKQNQYQTSTIVKHLFEKQGFNAVYEDALPDDLANNRCLGLLANLVEGSSLFSTKTTIVLLDCQSNEVFSTIEGKSKTKDYKGAYREAITEAFVSFQGIDYAYVPKVEEKEKVVEKPITVSFKDDVKNLEENPGEKVIVQEATTENQTYKSIKPVESTYTKVEKVEMPTAQQVLYAQPTENGFQLVDNTPKVVMKLVKTSVDTIFLVDHHGVSGVVHNKDGEWLFEYVDGGRTKRESLNIKF